ncbi:MAG TPA: hypothetical protein ENI75_02115 [Mizugakiibacter sp.]|nr:hypothetical protein [Mizugakiibacter sp.]
MRRSTGKWEVRPRNGPH